MDITALASFCISDGVVLILVSIILNERVKLRSTLMWNPRASQVLLQVWAGLVQQRLTTHLIPPSKSKSFSSLRV